MTSRAPMNERGRKGWCSFPTFNLMRLHFQFCSESTTHPIFPKQSFHLQEESAREGCLMLHQCSCGGPDTVPSTA
jgi:hypothetical protein